MDFRFFQKLFERAALDEIKVIGRDVINEGHLGHILGMTRKGRQAMLYILEMCESLEELGGEQGCASQEMSEGEAQEVPRGAHVCEVQEVQEVGHTYDVRKASSRKFCTEATPREQMKQSMQSERNRGFFLHIRSFQVGDKILETAGATSGNMQNGDYAEAYVLFMQFLQAGWRVAEESPFYRAGWKNLAITCIELREEVDKLPEWKDEAWITYDTVPKDGAVELPITLEVGETKALNFSMQDGRSATCYINRVYLTDVWAEEEKRFADPAYRERMLQHVSEEQLEQMKAQLFEGLTQICPKGMCFPVVEYECTENVGLRFLDRGYLDTIQEPSKGSATSVLMTAKPDAETGSHGLKLRACVIQTPIEPETEQVEAELFSYTQTIEKRTVKLS